MLNWGVGSEQQPLRANQLARRLQIDRGGSVERGIDIDIRVAENERQRRNARVDDEGQLRIPPGERVDPDREVRGHETLKRMMRVEVDRELPLGNPVQRRSIKSA